MVPHIILGPPRAVLVHILRSFISQKIESSAFAMKIRLPRESISKIYNAPSCAISDLQMHSSHPLTIILDCDNAIMSGFAICDTAP